MKRVDYWVMLVLGGALTLGSWQGWFPYELVETLGFVTGAACVYLVTRQDILNFPIGIANNVAFTVLFFYNRLYGDAALQIVYVVLAAHGWYQWLYGGHNRTALRVERASAGVLLNLSGFVVAGTIGLTYLLRAVSGAAPVLDALTTVLS